MQRSLRLILCVALTLTLIGGVARAETVANELVFHAGSTTRVPLQVPPGTYFQIDVAARESPEDYAHFQVEGKAALGGYMLAPQATNAADHYGVRLPAALHYADEEVFGRDDCYVQGSRCELAPGEYWLYVIAEGGEATVTLRFSGAMPAVAGAASPVETQFVTGTNEGPRADVIGAETSHFTGGGESPANFLGLGYAVWDKNLPPLAESSYASAHGFCVYAGAPDRFLPGCPDAGAQQYWTSVEHERDRAYLGSYVARSLTGVASGSMYHLTGGMQPTILGSAGVWIPR